MSSETALTRIKEKGYWKITFRPTVYKADALSLKEANEIVESCQVRLRGWYYPHIQHADTGYGGVSRGADYCLGWFDDDDSVKEVWRMYKSGQFVHYKALWEDRQEHPRTPEEPYLGVVSSLSQNVTEMFEFFSRLAQTGKLGEQFEVAIDFVSNVPTRVLWVDDPMKWHFFQRYATSAPSIPFNKIYTMEEILRVRENALELIMTIEQSFGRDNHNFESIAHDQEELLSGKLPH